jgi:hypothetical protein
VVGDAAKVVGDAPKADLLFSCPPYGDLEVYSDLPGDISAMAWDDFLAAYRTIIARACDRLQDDRFAVWVVGDIREPKTGVYRGFVVETIAAFETAGLRLYNEGVLVTAIGSLALRAGKQFEASRKLGKTHQNVLVFVKGDGKRATAACGPVQMADLPSDQTSDHDEQPPGGTDGQHTTQAAPIRDSG